MHMHVMFHSGTGHEFTSCSTVALDMNSGNLMFILHRLAVENVMAVVVHCVFCSHLMWSLDTGLLDVTDLICLPLNPAMFLHWCSFLHLTSVATQHT